MTASLPEAARVTGRGPASRAVGVARLGVLAACAVAVYVFEALLPMPVPWARVGLSNVVIVVCLFAYGFESALIVNLVRIVVGNLLLGLVASPAFLFSAAGSTAALLAMGVVRWKMVPPLSVVGTSIVGAVANNAVQVWIFSAMFSASAAGAGLIGVFILLGLGVGSLTGVLAARVIDKVGLARYGSVG